MTRFFRSILGISLAAVLMLGPLLATPGSAAADYGCVYLPWVPNGVTIDDPMTEGSAGPFRSVVRVQNLEDEPISIFFMGIDDCGTPNPGGYYEALLDPHQTVAYPASFANLIPDGSGGAMVIAARLKSDIQEPAKIAAAQRQVSPISPTFLGGSNSNHQITSGYTALDTSGLSMNSFLPIVQTNSNWNTLIRATNFHPQNATDIEVMLIESGSGNASGPYILPAGPGQTATFDLRDMGVADDWVGSARIMASTPIGAIAERIKVETNMLLINTSVHLDDGLPGSDGFGVAPIIFRDWNNWNTGLSVANFANEPNDVTVKFYDMDGVEVFSDTMTLPALGMDFIYLPAGDGEPFLGSAMIHGTRALYGAVDEVKYFGNDGDTGHAMSYMLTSRGAREGDALAFPFYARGDAVDASGDTSGIQIYNIGNSAAEVEIMFYNPDGTPALSQPESLTLPGNQSETIYSLDFAELPVGFMGSAVVSNIAPGLPGESGIVAVSNLVNYDVQYDGSATFNQVMFSQTGSP